MHINLAEIIQELLFEHEQVSVPGFGIFSKKYKTANIDYINGKINPPTDHTTLELDKTTNDDLLLKKIQDKYQFSEEKSFDVLQQFILEVNKIVENHELVVFPKIGKLYKNNENEIIFLPDNTNFNTSTFGLPELNFYPVSRIQEIKENHIIEQEKIKEQGKIIAETESEDLVVETVDETGNIVKKVDKNFFRKVLPIVAVLGLVIYGIFHFFFKSDAQKDLIYKNVEDKSKQVIDSTITTATADSSIITAPIAHVDNLVKNELPPVDKQLDNYIDGKKSELKPQKSEQTLESNTSGSKIAKIVIGKFSNENNVAKLKSALKNKGFDVETQQTGGLTKVIATFGYDSKSEMNDKLTTIRNNFAKDAFILKN
jgi:nucleoid DNA-binding protein